MSEERLEEIKESVKEIMETPYGIRHIKANEIGIDLVMTGKVDFLLQEIDLLNEQNERYREALEFYADYNNYKLSAEAEKADLTEFINNLDMDNGAKARRALEDYNEQRTVRRD